MTTNNINTGALGERLAREYLTAHAFVIADANYRAPEGEIDLVAEKDNELVFIEVKTRRGRRCGVPEEAVTPAKQAKLIAVAQRYLQEHGREESSWRIDVMCIELNKMDKPRRLELIEHAVGQVE
jgi:putative endonuclease